MRHTEPEEYGKPSMGCLIVLSIFASAAVLWWAGYWLAKALISHLHHLIKL